MQSHRSLRLELDVMYIEANERSRARDTAVRDPTTLIVIDEADRLRMNNLEEVRDRFDLGGAGVVLIGMPGIGKLMARCPQLYSRIGLQQR